MKTVNSEKYLVNSKGKKICHFRLSGIFLRFSKGFPACFTCRDDGFTVHYSLTTIHCFLCIVLLLLGGCGESPQKATGPLEKVTIGITNELIGALPYIADAKGFFKEEGLDVSLKQYPSGQRALEGMFKYESDIAMPAETPVMLYSFERQDFWVIATIGASDSEAKIIARRDHGISKQSDLKGRKIATQQGSAVHYYLSSFLLHNRIAETDLKIVYLKAEEIAPALIKGSVDAISMRDPFTKQAQDALRDNAVELKLPGIYRKTCNIVSTKKFIGEKPETIKKFMKALLKAEKYIQKNWDESIAITAKASRLESNYVASVWEIYRYEISLDQSLLLSLEDQARWAIKNKLTVKKDIPNYLNYIYIEALKESKPEAVRIIR